MGRNFLVHMYLEQQIGEPALALLQTKLLPVFPHSQIIESQIAMTHYVLRDYDLAQECFEVCREKDPYRIESIDTYSNILYVKERRVLLSYLAHSVTKVFTYCREVIYVNRYANILRKPVVWLVIITV